MSEISGMTVPLRGKWWSNEPAYAVEELKILFCSTKVAFMLFPLLLDSTMALVPGSRERQESKLMELGCAYQAFTIT